MLPPLPPPPNPPRIPSIKHTQNAGRVQILLADSSSGVDRGVQPLRRPSLTVGVDVVDDLAVVPGRIFLWRLYPSKPGGDDVIIVLASQH